MEAAIVINSDSEDEKITRKLETRSNSLPVCRACKGICGAPDNMPLLPPSTSQSSALDALFPRSRLRAPKRTLQTLVELFPVINDVNREFRAMLGKEYTEANVMRFMQYYIRTMRQLQEQVHKYPNKCRALSRNVCRTLLLIKRMSTNVIEQTPYYMQKICELLAIYMFLELRYASSYAESKARTVERIVNNILLHLESPDITYVLRIFAYIPFTGKEAYIVSRVFQRLIPIVVSGSKNEFNDRLYVQYLIAFYHWKDAETLPNCQENVIALANAFMKPKRTLKSSIVYARHLPCYEKRENATRYFLTNLVFFNDLRNASLLDGVAVMVNDTIDLSDEVELLCTDYSELELKEVEQQKDGVKTESVPRVMGTVDLTEEEETPWLTSLARTARDREVKLTTIQRKTTPEVIELDSSDDESWAVGNRATDSKSTENEQEKGLSEGDEWTRTSQRACSSDVFLDLPDDSSSDVLIRAAITRHEKGTVSRKDDTTSTTEKRLNFEGIIEEGFNSLHLTSCTATTSSGSYSTLTSSLSVSASGNVSENISEELNLNPRASTSTCASASGIASTSSITNGCASTSANAVASTSATSNANTSTSALSSLSTSASMSASTSESSSATANASANTSTSTMSSTSTSVNTSANESSSSNTNENAMQTSETERTVISDLEKSVEMSGETESEKEATGRAIVADILTNFSEGTSPIYNDSHDDRIPESETEPVAEECAIGESTIDDSAAAPKEAVTLNLESYTNSFICGEENDEFLRFYDTTPPVKTYLRKTPKRPEIQIGREEETIFETSVSEKSSDRNVEESITTPPTSALEVEKNAVVEENRAQPEDEQETAPPALPASGKATETDQAEVQNEQTQEQAQSQNESVTDGAANVLFSRRVISLREDDCSNGRMTPPSCLKVPESVEVSSQGSNVVFSMQGRRLSSFPPLQVSSSNDHVMPDFDADFFSEGEETPQNKSKETQIATPAVTTFPKTIIKPTEVDNEKPTAKRRTVWFSDKTEVREFAPRDELSEYAIQSSLINISTSINSINATKQQFLPSTSHQQQQQQQQHQQSSSTTSSLQPPPIKAYKLPTSTSTLAAATPSTTSASATPAINSILLKKPMPPPTPTSPDTASLKSAQEKDPHTNDDNRTDDVLAAAEILANGIRLVQTIAQPSTSLCCDGGVAVADASPQSSPSPPIAPALASLSLPPPPPTPPQPPPPPPPSLPPPPSSSSGENKIELNEYISASEIQQLIEASVECAEVNVALKRNGPMMTSPTGSDGNDSVLEGFVPIRRQRVESVDDYEQFYRCHYSPNNMKRLIAEGHISLPLKKRRKLSEYSEDNDFLETYDNDTVLNLKMPRNEVPSDKPKQPSTKPAKAFVQLEKDLKEISYPSEPMLSIAHFEKDGYREKSKDLSLKRPYPLVPPPRYSDVIRDCRPMVAHQQGVFQHPDQPQLQQSNSNPTLPPALLRELFPHLFVAKDKTENEIISEITDMITTPAKSNAATYQKKLNATATKKITSSSSRNKYRSSSSCINYNINHNLNANQIENRRKSATTPTTSTKPILSEFDRYLLNLQKKRDRDNTHHAKDVKKKRQRRKSSNCNSKQFVPVKNIKSLVDITSDIKLNKLRTRVVIERDYEDVFRASLRRNKSPIELASTQQPSIAVVNAIPTTAAVITALDTATAKTTVTIPESTTMPPMKPAKDPQPEPMEKVNPTEYVVRASEKSSSNPVESMMKVVPTTRPETKSLGDILTDIVEQEVIAQVVKDKVLPMNYAPMVIEKASPPLQPPPSPPAQLTKETPVSIDQPQPFVISKDVEEKTEPPALSAALEKENSEVIENDHNESDSQTDKSEIPSPQFEAINMSVCLAEQQQSETESPSPPNDAIAQSVEEKTPEALIELQQPEVVTNEDEVKPPVETDPSKTELKTIKLEDVESEMAASGVNVPNDCGKTSTESVTVPDIIVSTAPGNEATSNEMEDKLKESPISPVRLEVAEEVEVETEPPIVESEIHLPTEIVVEELMPDEALESVVQCSDQAYPVANESIVQYSEEVCPPVNDVLESIVQYAEQEFPTENNVAEEAKEIKIRLKRYEQLRGEKYVIVSNTGDTERRTSSSSERSYVSKRKRSNRMVSNDEEDRIGARKHDVTESNAKKEVVLKKIFERYRADELEKDCNHHRRDNNNQHVVNNGHNIESISTPPPTPPSRSLSPPPSSLDSKSLGKNSSESGRPRGEQNNNHNRLSFRRSSTLSSYLSTNSDMIQEFRKHVNMPTEVEIDSNSLVFFYEYLIERKDDRAKEEISKIMPLLKAIDSSTTLSSHRRRLDPCQRRARKHSSSEFHQGSSVKDLSAIIKRRKTICSDSHYLLSSPDIDEDICSSPKAADSPTAEVMRLHSSNRAKDLSAIVKRRKTICSDSHYLLSSPDIDEDVCSSPNAADSPTAEVMRLHSSNRLGLLKKISKVPETVTSPAEDGKEPKHNDTAEDMNIQSSQFHTTQNLTPECSSKSSTSSSSLSLTSTMSSSSPSSSAQYKSFNFSKSGDSSSSEQQERSRKQSRRNKCESPPDNSRNVVVSRTYSKSNMVQHVFVPPEIEKFIEEEASTVDESTKAAISTPSTLSSTETSTATVLPTPPTTASSSSSSSSSSSWSSSSGSTAAGSGAASAPTASTSSFKRHTPRINAGSCSKTRKIRRIVDFPDTDDEDDNDDSNDEDFNYEEEIKELSRCFTNSGGKRTRKKTKPQALQKKRKNKKLE